MERKKPIRAANPWHRAERWTGGRVERNRKRYRRKGKDKWDRRKEEESYR